MVDSVAVFPPGFRVLDSNGNPVNNAKIKFREVGGGDGKDVFSDKDLTDPSNNLGSIVRTRSDGYPVVSFGSQTTTLIYTDSTPYHIEITDENDNAIFPAKDNVRGALDTSAFLTTSSTSTFNEPVLSKTADYTVLAADKAKLLACNASGGFFTITLLSAITAGDGFTIGIRNDGTANPVGISAAQNIATPFGSITSFSLRIGETVWLTSNGATWKISKYVPAPLRGTHGTIIIADRLSTPPVSPVAGDRYIVGSGPTDAWSTFAQHDIAEATGQGSWFKVTPPTDCGWLAYVQDEDLYYRFIGSAWRSEAASDTTTGTLEIADQSEMEAATDVLKAVVPGRQHFHPGHPKAWVTFNGTGTVAISRAYKVTSITDNGTGDYTINFDLTFSDTNFAWSAGGNFPTSNLNNSFGFIETAKATTSFRFTVVHNAVGADLARVSVTFFGDL